MERGEAGAAIDDHRRALVHLLEDLSEREWRQPSPCERWAVRQVAAHLALQDTTWPAMPRVMLGSIRPGGMNSAIHAVACRHAVLPSEAIIGQIRDRIGAWRPLPAVTFRETAIDYLMRPGHRHPARPDPADARRPRRPRPGPGQPRMSAPARSWPTAGWWPATPRGPPGRP